MNVGVSVSRVGGSAQIKAMKKIAGPLRVNLAQYRELAVFAQFGSDLDKATRDKLVQGEHLLETLKQTQYSPMPVEDQVIVLYIASNKYLMDVPVKDVKKFTKKLAGVYKRELFPHTGVHLRDRRAKTGDGGIVEEDN